MEIILGLGSNLGKRQTILELAVELIHKRIGKVVGRSKWYETKPLLHPQFPTLNQEMFLNGVVAAEVDNHPEEIIKTIWLIEEELGRDRTVEKVRWGPRLIDIDLICAEDLILNTTNLKIPHPEMHKRDFVLRPMIEVAPKWIHPALLKTVEELFQELS